MDFHNSPLLLLCMCMCGRAGLRVLPPPPTRLEVSTFSPNSSLRHIFPLSAAHQTLQNPLVFSSPLSSVVFDDGFRWRSRKLLFIRKITWFRNFLTHNFNEFTNYKELPHLGNSNWMIVGIYDAKHFVLSLNRLQTPFLWSKYEYVYKNRIKYCKISVLHYLHKT